MGPTIKKRKLMEGSRKIKKRRLMEVSRKIMKRKLMEGSFKIKTRRLMDIIHPQHTNKEYRSIKLHNGLSAILISDHTVSQSAAALTVRFGSFSDPAEMQGMAHLIEHMVFHEDNELKAFVRKYGGEVNAQTEMEYTTFHMRVDSEQLEGALKRFAHLFINPLLKVEHIEKEINTIDSEFLLHKCKDSSRLEQLIGHTSPEDHPYNRFAWGNKHSLGVESAQSLRDKAMELFNEHYVAHSMNLVVMGEESLDLLEEWVNQFFSLIKRGNFCCPARQPTTQNIWNSDVFYVLPSVENVQKLYITWLLPPLSKTFTNRPENCLVQLLSHESKGSLCSFLKDKEWISSLNVEVGSDTSFKTADLCSYKCTSAGRLFTISLDITNIGLEEKYQIVKYVYQYLNLVRTSLPEWVEWVEEEYSASLKLKFEYLDVDDCFVDDPSMFAQRLAGNMFKCPASHVLCLEFLNDFGGTEEIQKMLEHFHPQNMRIDLLKPKPLMEEDEGFKTVRWFDATYIEEKIPSSLKATWETSKVDSSLELPQWNEFIASNFSVRDLEESSEVNESEEEEEVNSSEVDEQDSEVDELDDDDVVESFEVDEEDSKTFIYKKQRGMSNAFFCVSLNVRNSVEDHMKTNLLIEMVKDELSPILFKGSEACINTSVSFRDDNKLELLFDGYRANFKLFVTTIWNLIRSFEATSHQRFETIKETMVREVYATSLDLTVYAGQLLSEAIIEGFGIVGKLNALEKITFEDFPTFVTHLLSQRRITSLFFGDLTKDESREIFDSLETVTAGTLELPRELRGMKALTPGSPVRINATAKNELESNSLAKIYFQLSCKKDDFDRVTALLHVFQSIIEEPLFQQLRVQDGLGYDVGCDAHSFSGIKGFYLYVVSPNYQPQDLLQRMYNFLKAFKDILADVDESVFEDYQSGVLSSLRDESGKALWDLIVDDIDMKGYYSRAGFEIATATLAIAIKALKQRAGRYCVLGRCNLHIAVAMLAFLRYCDRSKERLRDRFLY